MSYAGPQRWKLAPVLVVLVGVLNGCRDSGAGRFEVSGAVTYKGKPVPAGQVIFEPDPAKGNTGPQGYARMKDGKFKTLSKQGSVGGPVIVTIVCCDGVVVSEEMPFGSLLFAPPYKVHTELPYEDSTQDFIVPSQEDIPPMTEDDPELELMKQG